MSTITINPEDVQRLETPLYKKDGNTVYLLLPESVATQIKMAAGDNVEVRIANLTTSVNAANSLAQTAKDNAATAQGTANQAKMTVNQANSAIADLSETVDEVSGVAASAKTTANAAKATADAVNAQVGNATTGLAATKTIADNALTVANQAKSAAVVMVGATTSADGQQGLVPKPVISAQKKFLRGDGTWAEAVSAIDPQLIYGLKTFVGQGNPLNVPLAYFKDPYYSLDAPVTSRALLWFIDSADDYWHFASLGVEHYENGDNNFIIQVRGSGTDTKPWHTFHFRGPAPDAAYGHYAVLGTPPDNALGGETPSCAWVLSKLGSGASLTALATFDTYAEDYVETLEIKKLKACAKINAEASQAIFGGFLYEHGGREYLISYSLFDQQNLADKAIQALANPEGTFSVIMRDYEEGTEAGVTLSAQEMIELHATGVARKDEILAECAKKKVKIMGAENETEISKIVVE